MFHTSYTDDVEHNNHCLTSPINDSNLKCMPKVVYEKVATGGNDPHITAKGRYSQMVNQSGYLRLTVAAAIAAGFLKPDGSANSNGGGCGGGGGNNNLVQCPIYRK